MKSDSLERITNLLLCFKQAKRPLTLKQITDSVEGYPSYVEAFNTCRQVFMRDRQVLKDHGYNLVTVPVPTKEKFGYLLEDSRKELSSLILNERESKLLNYFLLILKNGLYSSFSDSVEETNGIANLFNSVDLSSILKLNGVVSLAYKAIAGKSKLSFVYHDKHRDVFPLKIFFKIGNWYLVSYELDSKTVKSFRIDRISSIELVEGDFKIPELNSVLEQVNVLEDLLFFDNFKNEKILVKCYVKSPEIDSFVSIFKSKISPMVDDDGYLAEFEATESDFFYSQLLQFGEDIEVIEPIYLRVNILEYLYSFVEYKVNSN